MKGVIFQVLNGNRESNYVLADSAKFTAKLYNKRTHENPIKVEFVKGKKKLYRKPLVNNRKRPRQKINDNINEYERT